MKENPHKEPFEYDDEDRGKENEVFEGMFNALGIMFLGAFIVWIGWQGIQRQKIINQNLHKLDVQLSHERPTVDVR